MEVTNQAQHRASSNLGCQSWLSWTQLDDYYQLKKFIFLKNTRPGSIGILHKWYGDSFVSIWWQKMDKKFLTKMPNNDNSSSSSSCCSQRTPLHDRDGGGGSNNNGFHLTYRFYFVREKNRQGPYSSGELALMNLYFLLFQQRLREA